ncbi:hypothetical protein ACIGD1_34445 [Streptomyces sp. NPDC085612]|uniref:hypothetical protein n=1 Tax=Streptomyces sp. NPDC085612 TaxID=3365732 RepID=UPI0037D595BE
MDDATLALATTTVGLDRLRDPALGDTADAEDTTAALQALARTGPPRESVLGLLRDLLDDDAARRDDDGLEAAAKDLSEAIGFFLTSTGLAEPINSAAHGITALIGQTDF